MPRFKHVERGMMLLAVDLEGQIQPGTFEHALCTLVDSQLDLSRLRSRFKNDLRGAPAYDPAVLTKIVLLAYSRGIISSRRIAEACDQSVLFMAVSGDSHPDFTLIARFIAELGDEVAELFQEVLLVCHRLGLIGKELFAIDGVKLPSNASKAKSGTRADFMRQADKMEKAVQAMMDEHRRMDAPGAREEADRLLHKANTLKTEAAKVRAWLKNHPDDRRGSSAAIRQSNRTDNDSAKMATDKGVIQGYTGVAAVDAHAQIVVEAQALGSGSEQEILLPMVDATAALRAPDTVICADAGYHSAFNLKGLADRGVDAFLCDNGYRQRDPRYAGQQAYRSKPDPLWDKSTLGKAQPRRLFKSAEFTLADDQSHAVCPAGKRLYRSGSNCTIGGRRGLLFKGTRRDCAGCPLRTQCLRKPETTPFRQVAFLQEVRAGAPSLSAVMKARIDSPEGKRMIAARFATVEPVFGNLRRNKGLNRFTLRGQAKVDGQWKLYCLVHNIEKMAHHGYGCGVT